MKIPVFLANSSFSGPHPSLPRSTGSKTIVDGLEFIIIVEVDNGNKGLMGNIECPG